MNTLLYYQGTPTHTVRLQPLTNSGPTVGSYTYNINDLMLGPPAVIGDLDMYMFQNDHKKNVLLLNNGRGQFALAGPNDATVLRTKSIGGALADVDGVCRPAT